MSNYNYTKENAINLFKSGCDDYFNSISHNCIPINKSIFEISKIIDVAFKKEDINGIVRLFDSGISYSLTIFYGGEPFNSNNIILLTKEEYLELGEYYYGTKPEKQKVDKKEGEDMKRHNMFTFVFIFCLLLLLLYSIYQYFDKKVYGGKIKSKYITSGYKGNPSYHVVFYNNDLNKLIDVDITQTEYANIDTSKHGNIEYMLYEQQTK